MHWYDMEYAGCGIQKVADLPKSDKSGSIGKYVIIIVHGDHPWTTAYENGAKKAAAALGMKIDMWSPNWDVNQQNRLIAQAIGKHPDAIAVIPDDQKASTQQFRQIYQAGIPAFGTNTLPSQEASKYIEGWTGPNDWGQMRKLARFLADKMGKKGGICYVTHNPGTSPYFARMDGPISELSKYAPDIKTLDHQSPGFDAAKTKQVVNDWITKFGKQLNAIFLADDSSQALGTSDALAERGRTDVLIVAAGNSKQGMDLVKAGKMLGITYQTAEGDGAACVHNMAMFFDGKPIAPVAYLAQDIITKDNVAGFYPPQW
jgi:ribose transport system substrate-binding protein